jgi:enamine deaminase RidA (YjgF/YER057c/UK114 family)
MSTPSERLKKMGITLPSVPKPVAAYVPYTRHGNLLLLSGQVPVKNGKIMYEGRVGAEHKLETAQEAAQLCALNAIAVGAEAAGGIDNIDRVLKVVVYVAAHESFSDPHLVANGASNFLGEVFGEAGAHARAAVGVAVLPLNATVEVDVTFSVKA